MANLGFYFWEVGGDNIDFFFWGGGGGGVDVALAPEVGLVRKRSVRAETHGM